MKLGAPEALACGLHPLETLGNHGQGFVQFAKPYQPVCQRGEAKGSPNPSTHHRAEPLAQAVYTHVYRPLRDQRGAADKPRLANEAESLLRCQSLSRIEPLQREVRLAAIQMK